MIVRELTSSEFDGAVARLAAILVDAVDSGAGVTFMHPLAQDVAEAYWMKQKADVASGQTTVFVADENGVIGGTVMLQKVWPPNQPHRCEVTKLLVHRDFRRRGLATLLMQTLEAKAKGLGFKLITFDAVAKSPAETLYRQLGFTCAGYIPNYAYAKGKLDGTALFYKEL